MGSSPGMMAWRCDFNCKPTGVQLMTEGDQPGEGFKDAFFTVANRKPCLTSAVISQFSLLNGCNQIQPHSLISRQLYSLLFLFQEFLGIF